MVRIAELGSTARQDGYQDSLLELETVLRALYSAADTAFQLQRETDSNYQDVRTDYLLGRREAVAHVLRATRAAE